MDGQIVHVINEYLNSNKSKNAEICWTSLETAPGDHQVRLKAVRVVSGNQSTFNVDIDKDFTIEVDYWNLRPDSRRLVSIHICNSMGITILTSGNLSSACITPDPWYSRPYPKGLFRTTCTIPGLLLNEGTHSISLYINGVGAHDNIIVMRDVLSFNVVDTGLMREEYHGEWIGAVRPCLDWRTVQLE